MTHAAGNVSKLMVHPVCEWTNFTSDTICQDNNLSTAKNHWTYIGRYREWNQGRLHYSANALMVRHHPKSQGSGKNSINLNEADIRNGTKPGSTRPKKLKFFKNHIETSKIQLGNQGHIYL